MTIIEAITHVDTVKPNSYGQTEKIKWLSDIDGMIKAEVIDTHEGGEDISFSGYTDETDLNTKLLAPAPYDKLYTHYLEMQIDYANNEYGKYKSVLVAIPKGTKVKNYGFYTTVNGMKWLYVQVAYNGVTYTGFASSKHLVKI